MRLVLPVEEMTKQMPLPGLFLRFIGVAEVLGAIGLILPGLLRIRLGLTPLAAAGLVIIMIGATVITLAGGDVAMALVPLVVGLLSAFAAYGRWRRIAGCLTRHKVPKGQVELTRKISLEIMKEPGCEQFEVFQSVVNSDKLTLLERWPDQAALV
jgi:hypothetical protein